MKDFGSGVRMAALLGAAVLSACAGYIRGVDSAPYVDPEGPVPDSPGTAFERSRLHQIELPPLSLYVSLNNRAVTSRWLIWFFIPVPLQVGNEADARERGRLQARIHVTAAETGYGFSPSRSRIRVDGRTYSSSAAWLVDKEAWRRSMDRYQAALAESAAAARAGASAETPEPEAGDWREPVGDRVSLDRIGESYWFVIEFPIPVPAPGSDIALDLGPALDGGGLVMPLIRFREVTWSETQG